jgi:hypothetical protein
MAEKKTNRTPAASADLTKKLRAAGAGTAGRTETGERIRKNARRMIEQQAKGYSQITVILKPQQLAYLDGIAAALGLRARQLPASAVIRAALDALSEAGLDYSAAAAVPHAEREDAIRALIAKRLGVRKGSKS